MDSPTAPLLATPAPAGRGLILPWNGVLPALAADVFIAPGAVVIGDTSIGPGSSIWFGTIVRGDVHRIQIGSQTNIQDASVVHVTEGRSGTRIGDRVTIGHGAVLHACTVEDDSFIGMRALILDEAVVESGAMLAAGAVLTPGKRVPRGELWAGSPAKKLRSLEESDVRAFQRSAERYAALATQYKAQGVG